MYVYLCIGTSLLYVYIYLSHSISISTLCVYLYLYSMCITILYVYMYLSHCISIVCYEIRYSYHHTTVLRPSWKGASLTETCHRWQVSGPVSVPLWHST